MSDKTKIEWSDATGHMRGALKTAAKRLGIPFAEYLLKINSGLKYCWKCEAWHGRDSFNIDKSRADGLTAICRDAKSRISRSKYITKERKRRGFLVETRNGDKKQARRRINYLVEQGLIPHPDDIPCFDCQDEIFVNQYRHEYDHARGYDGENQLYVEPVCSRCHHNREEARRNGKSA